MRRLGPCSKYRCIASSDINPIRRIFYQGRTLRLAADQLALNGIVPHETMRQLKAMARLRRAVVERHVLTGIPCDAV
jgi:hypothetical protein